MEDVSITINPKYIKMINSPLGKICHALTGVSVTFAPYFLYMYGQGNNVYSNGQTRKTLAFISFPLSGITNLAKEHYQVLDQTLQVILDQYQITNESTIVLIDYLFSGGSYHNILNSFRRIFKQPSYNFEQIVDLQFNLPTDCNLIEELTNSEINNSRCIASYRLTGAVNPDFMSNKYTRNVLRV